MPAHFVALITTYDHERMNDYVRTAAPTFAKYGGRVALLGPVVDVVEGDLGDLLPETTLVVLEFELLEAARRWYESDEYQPVIKLREPPVASTTAFFVGGSDRAS